MKKSYLCNLLLSASLLATPLLASDIEEKNEPAETALQAPSQTGQEELTQLSQGAYQYVIDQQTRPAPTLQEIKAGLENINFRDLSTFESAMDLYRPVTVLKLVCQDLGEIKASDRTKKMPRIQELFEAGLFSNYFHMIAAYEILSDYTPFIKELKRILPKEEPWKSLSFLNTSQRKFMADFSKIKFSLKISPQEEISIASKTINLFSTKRDVFDFLKYDNIKKSRIILSLIFSREDSFKRKLQFGSKEAAEKAFLKVNQIQDTNTEIAIKLTLTSTKIWEKDSYERLYILFSKVNLYNEGLKWLQLGKQVGDPTSEKALAELDHESTSKKISFLKQSGKIDMALELALNLSTTLTDDTKLMYTIAYLYQKTGKIDEAIKWYKKAAKGSHLEAMESLANLFYFKKGNTGEAKKMWKIAAEKGSTYAQKNLGFFYCHKEKYEKAEKYFIKAAENGSISSLRHLGFVYLKLNRLDESEKLLKKAIDDGFTHAINNLGCLKFEQEKYEEAIKLFYKAREKKAPIASLSLAKFYEKQEKYTEAEKYFKEAISLGVKASESMYAKFLKDRGRHEEAALYEKNSRNSGSDDEYKGTEFVKPVSHAAGHLLTPEEEEDDTPGDKGYNKRMARLDKETQDGLTLINSLELKSVSKSYRDLETLVHPDAKGDIDGIFKTKIQGRLSNLANGEKRAHFKPRSDLGANICSMRLTKGDRLFFEILEGDMEQGVTKVKILAADGHGEKIHSRLTQSTTEALPHIWTDEAKAQ